MINYFHAESITSEGSDDQVSDFAEEIFRTFHDDTFHTLNVNKMDNTNPDMEEIEKMVHLKEQTLN